jgi:hypothetical protein
MNKQKLRQIVLWSMAADFPVLYVGAVSLENAIVTVAALAVMGVAVTVAAFVY